VFHLSVSRKNILLFLLFLLTANPAKAQSGQWFPLVSNGGIYFSWGYNKEWYSPSNVHVRQESLGNDYTLKQVKAQDHPGWNTGVFNKPLTVPQYNYRLGYFFNKKQDWAFEINFDHTKYIIRQHQYIRLQGTLHGAAFDGLIPFTYDSGFYYYLNNGANFLLFNLVKRFPVFHNNNKKFRIDALAKAGIGPVIPHVENCLFGQKNDDGFQLGGWNAGVETALRATVMKYAYLELAQKADYARYSGLSVYKGKAKQAFATYELILSIGITLPTGKNNTEFHAPKPIE